jgi:RNA recognition motif-containing protein
MNSSESQGKHVLFISELPDNIIDSELKEFFKDYESDLIIIQIDRNQKMYDLFNTRKPKATIVFKTHEKAEEARNKLNMRRLKGKALNIMWHERDNSVRYNNKSNIFVKGISLNANPRDIYELFAKLEKSYQLKFAKMKMAIF